MPSPLESLPVRKSQPTGLGPLAGIRVVDFTRVLAGPFGTQILGDLGAEVIKIENPVGGDDTRQLKPRGDLGGEAAFFMSLNRSKLSVALDLKREAGRAVALDLIAQADVLVENFTGAVMRRFQLDYPSLKERFPRLIYCSVSGYGRSGPNADAAGYDSPLHAEGGATSLMANRGGRTVLPGLPYTDISTALNSAIGVLAALQARHTTGSGQHVDVAMFDSTLANLSFVGAEWLTSGNPPSLYDRQSAGPHGIFETADGEITITVGKDKMFEAFATRVAERPEWLEDERFATIPVRMQNGAAFMAEVVPLFKSQPSAYWSQRCKATGIPCGAVRQPGEALLSQEAKDRDMVFAVEHPTAGAAPVIAQPMAFSATPCRYGAPPLLGEHTREVLSDLLGYPHERIAALAADGAIGLGRE
jgi:formyl-CoA transferase